MMTPKAILYDSVFCVGCRACEAACARKWGLPYTQSIALEEKLSERKLTTIVTRNERFARRLCMHCTEPACASACPVSALNKTSLGPVVYEERRCIGCRYCMLACPFQVPVYEWSKTLPRVRKCDMCHERLVSGELTFCAEACEYGATVSGDRETLLKEAQRRIADSPKQYYGRVYGFSEVGGTSVLMLSSVPLEQFGILTNLPQEPLPALTRPALAFVPDVAGVGSVLLGGIYWITRRREEVAAAEGPPERQAKRSND